MTKAGATIVACMLLGAGTALAAQTRQQKCEVAKLKAQGVLQSCLKTNRANIILGKADGSPVCQGRFVTALAKADKKGTCRFIDNGDGTVTDLNTGLVWEKKDNLDGIVNTTDPHDADNVYSWCAGTLPSCTSASNPPDGPAYTDFLGKLNGGTSSDGSTITGCFASHCDWRLPTIAELHGIVDLSGTGCGSVVRPCIDPTFGPTQSASYWSATPSSSFPGNAWFVYFAFQGFMNPDLESDLLYVRAVRGGL